MKERLSFSFSPKIVEVFSIYTTLSSSKLFNECLSSSLVLIFSQISSDLRISFCFVIFSLLKDNMNKSYHVFPQLQENYYE